MNQIETAQALAAAWEARDVGASARLLSVDFALMGASPVALNRDAYLGFQALHNEAFPDWRFNMQDVSLVGDDVRCSYQISATHTGPYDVAKLGMPIPAIAPTGLSRSWPVEHMTVTVKDGRITAIDVETAPGGGVVGTLQWLGVDVPAPAVDTRDPLRKLRIQETTMATLTSARSTNPPTSLPWGKAAVLTLVLAAFAFLASPNAPLGGFWRPAATVPTPTSAQLPLFILLNIAEALTFGLGVSFLLFGLPMVRAIAPASGLLTRGAHLSIAWLLLNWWPHDSLHLHLGLELNGLLAIEYGFHITLMLAGGVLAAFYIGLLRDRPAR